MPVWTTTAGLRLALSVLGVLVPTPLLADEAVPTAKATVGGITVIASIITDTDWENKWYDNPVGEPQFETSIVLKLDQPAYVVTFFSGAMLKDGVASIECDLIVRRPDGRLEEHAPRPCYLQAPRQPEGSYIATGFSVFLKPWEPDPNGLYVFDVGVKDENSGVRIPLTVSVEVDKE
jgi:hypothetical protein